MHEFESFVYLDMEKTGSTFISALLRRFSKESEIQHRRHAGLEADCDRSKFYFISVRDPLDAYLSLYSYGCESRGKFGKALRKKGLDHLYDGSVSGFEKWLRFVLSPENVEQLGGKYFKSGGDVATLVGLQSFRYLKLCLPGGEQLLAECKTRDELRAVYAAQNLQKFSIRHESFNSDLVSLLRGGLSYAMHDVDSAVSFVETSTPMNVSQRIDSDVPNFAVRRGLRRKLQDREWLLHEIFGY